MATSSKKQILEDEMKVLAELAKNSKENIDTIAKNCGFSRQKVWRVVKQLVTNGMIWGYTVVSDENARNLKHFILLMKRSNVPFDEVFKKELTFNRLDDYASDIKTENIYAVHGAYDYVVTFYARDLPYAKKLVEEIFKRIGKYCENYLFFETLIPIRKQGIKNPQIKNLVDYL